MAPPPGNDKNRSVKKTSLSKERTTAHLDLREGLGPAESRQLDRLLETLRKKCRIVVIAGAGISVSAGIPDFRSSTGLFKTGRTENKSKLSGKDLFSAAVYRDDESTSSFHDMVRNLSKRCKDAKPTRFHELLVALAMDQRLLRLYTQNVDGIDVALEPLKTESPLPVRKPWPKTVQLHGTIREMICQLCYEKYPIEPDRFNGAEPPACLNCQKNDSERRKDGKRGHGVGKLRPRIVLYDEGHPESEAIGACMTADLGARPDAIIVVGTTLKVSGIRRYVEQMCKTVRGRRDGMNIWINIDPESIPNDLSGLWDLVVLGPCDEVARQYNKKFTDDLAGADDDESNESGNEDESGNEHNESWNESNESGNADNEYDESGNENEVLSQPPASVISTCCEFDTEPSFLAAI
jgi:NAD-dependent histone deacetylase SIR2